MTDDELIQKAIEHLKPNKVTEEMLSDPQVREAAVVYFKIRPHLNCMLTLDSGTGEQISKYFTPDPLLREYMDHCRRPKEAEELVRAAQIGQLDYFSQGATRPLPPSRSELLEMLRRRCPGWTDADYERNLASALSKFQSHVT
jgi:hypothetical protein